MFYKMRPDLDFWNWIIRT